MFKLILMTALLTSCGTSVEDFFERKTRPELPARNIDPALQPMIDQFLDDAQSYGVSTHRKTALRIAEFAEIEQESIVGYCEKYTYDNGGLAYLRIVIRPDFAERLDTMSYAGLMYHELGHCILNLEHSNDAGIMAPNIFPESYYEEYWDELVEELFTGE